MESQSELKKLNVTLDTFLNIKLQNMTPEQQEEWFLTHNLIDGNKLYTTSEEVKGETNE